MITEILTDKEELDCEIKIIVRSEKWGLNNEFWGIQIDNHVTPLYCCHCRTQLKNFYKLNGGRYGQVGTIPCVCGAEIHCTDSDNMVEYLDTLTTFGPNSIGKYYIDFVKIYKLENIFFTRLKEKTGFDLFSQYSNHTVALKTIIQELETEYEIKPEENTNYSFKEFERLPKIVNKWYSIIENLPK